MKLKSVRDQVVVLVGSSSGIGRVAAKRLAALGAKVVLAARSEDSLQSAVDEIRQSGGTAEHFVADVTRPEELDMLAQYTIEKFGRIDTWCHLAAVSLYAEVEQTELDEWRQVIETNLTGVFSGIKAALPHLKTQGGSLIVISSVEGYVSLPFQAAYAASKHGIIGLLDALRIELNQQQAPVSVTAILPSGIDTPFFDRARNKMASKPKPPAPVYSPESVADAIVYAAEHPVRELTVGSGGRFMIGLRQRFPAISDSLFRKVGYTQQQSDEPAEAFLADNLNAPMSGYDRGHGGHRGRRSISTWVRTHPLSSTALIAVGAAVVAAIAYDLNDEDGYLRSSHQESWTDRAGRHLGLGKSHGWHLHHQPTRLERVSRATRDAVRSARELVHG